MWYLIDLTTKKKTPYLLSNRNYKIGRKNPTETKNADIEVGDDPSVSRVHAEILIKFDEKICDDISQQANIVLTDHSKFGTFVNDVKVETFKALKINDIIKFGVSTYYKLCNDPLIVTASDIKPAAKSSLRKLIASLGGYLVNDWQNECSLLAMNEIKVTVKCLNALLCQRLIVTPKYLEDLVSVCSKLNASTIPDPNNYLPGIGEANLDSKVICFKPNTVRKALFENKKFIFLCSDQLQKLQNIIELAGGQCEMFNKLVHLKSTNLTRSKTSFLFLIDSSEKHAEIQAAIEKRLDSLNQRLIDDTEIGMAILYASTEEYCNASYLSEDHKKNKKIDKLCSQTQDIMAVELMECDDTDDEAIIPGKAIKRKSDILDSEQFQFENKAEHFCVVKDTQDIVNMNKSLNRDHLIDTSNIDEPEIKIGKKTIGKIWIDDTQDMFVKSTKKKSPEVNERNHAEKQEITQHTTSMKVYKKSDNQMWKDETQNMSVKQTKNNSPKENQVNLTDKQEINKHSFSMKTQETTLSSKSISSNNKTNSEEISSFSSINMKSKTNKNIAPITSTFKNMKQDLKSLNLTDIKNEPKENWHQKLPSKVYSKLKPPKESFIVKTESQSDQIQSQNLIKIKFENLVRKDFKYEISDSAGSDSSSGKVNFKKFKKIPKNLSQSSNNNTQGKKTNSQFKCFKEENFDLDTQFSQFMSSSKR